MSNLPIYVALIGVVALIYGILVDTAFDSIAIFLALLGISCGALVTLLITEVPNE